MSSESSEGSFLELLLGCEFMSSEGSFLKMSTHKACSGYLGP